VIEQRDLAGKVNLLLLKATVSLDKAAALMARGASSDKEKALVLLRIGKAMAAIGTGILNPLYRSHPNLKPRGYMLPEDFNPLPRKGRTGPMRKTRKPK
jgi:hypothetical protein